MTFQVSDLKGRNFLDLVGSDNNILEPTYCKGSTWLQFFGHSNMLCARATRAITNHALIGEYCFHFFPKEEFSCPCGLYSIEIRWHILHECRRFNEYWNPWRDSIAYFIQFLERNPRVFVFSSLSTQLGPFCTFLLFFLCFFFFSISGCLYSIFLFPMFLHSFISVFILYQSSCMQL